MSNLVELKNRYTGQTAYIVGKGPSLQYITKEIFGVGPVIALNEAIIAIESLNLSNDIYSMQKDKNDLGQSVPLKKATLLVHSHESLYRLEDYRPRYVFDNIVDFDLKITDFSVLSSIGLAKLMGCVKVVLVSLDASVTGDIQECIPLEDGKFQIKSEHISTTDYPQHRKRIDNYLQKTGILADWIIPKPNMVTIITPTGDRPQAIALCSLWMSNQTLQPNQWIVVDDGRIPLIPNNKMDYIRRQPKEDDPNHTLLLNLNTAIPLIKGSKILIMEDDEYYSPRYIEKMVAALDKHEIAGIGCSKYYHLPSGGYMHHENLDHASLAQTGFRSSFLTEFQELLTGNTFLDFRVWKKVGDRGFIFDDGKEYLYAGIKGLPGRLGTGCGHNREIYRQHDTPQRDILKEWTQDGFPYYSEIIKGMKQ
jgi:hypothetical protein